MWPCLPLPGCSFGTAAATQTMKTTIHFAVAKASTSPIAAMTACGVLLRNSALKRCRYSLFKTYARDKDKRYICKPNAGSQGKGISIFTSWEKVQPEQDMICQEYIDKPLLIDGFKFDMRIYVLVTSCHPWRIYMYKEGLARFCTTKYKDPTDKNVNDKCMHLTNFTINKDNENFIHDEKTGSKRRLSTLKKQLRSSYRNTEKIWSNIEDGIVKTLVLAHSRIQHSYITHFSKHIVGSACFQVLGFDVLLDEHFRPWVLEVNHSPDMSTPLPLDREVKDALLYDTLVLINLGPFDRCKMIKEEKRRVEERLKQNVRAEERQETEQQRRAVMVEEMETYEDEHLGGFKRIYPSDGKEKYDKYLKVEDRLYKSRSSDVGGHLENVQSK
ncbi:tubulin polyglutamylase ttll6-like isoform X3 [Entelurus aequoreus]|uniref:tubulin polyglutamylase ttll6-like isoform X3 n=1 Tax=Entelurus aequoreus TaxID=161455 RepID=UPI002B1CF704|nr:tubulin polyglutamylase ttll6-like isoform X3 [Entelurus aequoreus]